MKKETRPDNRARLPDLQMRRQVSHDYIKSAKQALQEMNARHAVVREAGRTVVIYEAFDPVLNRIVILRCSFADIRNFFNNQKVRPDGKRREFMPLGNFWLNHPQRRQYEGIVFSPDHDIPACYNLWRGFGVTPKPGDWSLMREHIAQVICHGDQQRNKYVCAWLASSVQHPGQQAEVALAFRGQQGTGKGVLARQYGALFGRHFVHLTHGSHLTGHFNAHLQDAVVVFADEAFPVDDKQAVGVLKALITEPTIVIERKHRDVVTAPNVTHIIIASNHDWVIPAGLDERRFCICDVATTHAQDHAYFSALQAQMDSGGREAMLHDLLKYDLTGIDLRAPPATPALLEQKFLTMSPVEIWWYEKLRDGRLLPSDTTWRSEILRDALHADFVAAMKPAGKKERAVQTILGIRLRKLLPEGFPGETQHQKQWYWTFPPLAVCRAHFDKLTKTQHTWPVDSSG